MRKFKISNIKSFAESDEIEMKLSTFFVGKTSLKIEITKPDRKEARRMVIIEIEI